MPLEYTITGRSLHITGRGVNRFEDVSAEETDMATYAATRVAEIEATLGPEVEVEPDHIIITHLAFRRLFQLNERIAFDNFEENPALTAEQKQTLRSISKDFEMAQEIDLKDPDVIGGLQFIESCGILGAGRAAEVLAYRP